MDITLIQHLSSGLDPVAIWVAQAPSTDVMTSFQDAWSNFVQSGQVWALGIGFVIGYIFRSLTAY